MEHYDASVFVPATLLLIFGVTFLAAAILNAEVFYRGGRARLVASLITRSGLRIVYAMTGLFTCGFALWFLKLWPFVKSPPTW